MSFLDELPPVPQWDPAQGDLTQQHGLFPVQPAVGKPAQWPSDETPQQLIAAGWTPCPRCQKFWISPENKAQVQAHGGYFTCPKCKLTSDLMENLPWHGVQEPDFYPRGNTGGGTAIGLPLEDVAQIGENIVQEMHEIPGYGPITWWHGSAREQSALDGATAEWGLEVKAVTYDAQGHFWDPGRNTDGNEVTKKNEAAQEMGLKGVLGVMVLLNFRNDTADVYVKEMPLVPWATDNGQTKSGIVKWHKRTGQKVASGIPFTSPYKDPANPAPGPYSLADHYEKPRPPGWQAPEPAVF